MAGLRGRGSRPGGGVGGLQTTALIRGQREARGDSRVPWAAVPAPSYPARSPPEGGGVGPRPSTRGPGASDAAPGARGHLTPEGSLRLRSVPAERHGGAPRASPHLSTVRSQVGEPGQGRRVVCDSQTRPRRTTRDNTSTACHQWVSPDTNGVAMSSVVSTGRVFMESPPTHWVVVRWTRTTLSG